MRKRVKFEPIAPHHLYMGLFLMFISWTMLPYSYYYPLCEYTMVIGLLVVIDDLVEHLVTGSTPLRLLFEKAIIKIIKRL
jgi:hypothetical protein